jgi:hypothetical protein
MSDGSSSSRWLAPVALGLMLIGMALLIPRSNTLEGAEDTPRPSASKQPSSARLTPQPEPPAPAASAEAAAPAPTDHPWFAYGCPLPELVGTPYRYQTTDPQGLAVSVEDRINAWGVSLTRDVPQGEVPILIEGYREAVLSWTHHDDGSAFCDLSELEPAEVRTIAVTGLEGFPEGTLTASLCGPTQEVGSAGTFELSELPSDCTEAELHYAMGEVRATMTVPIEVLESLEVPLTYETGEAVIMLPQNGDPGVTLHVPLRHTQAGVEVMALSQISDAAPDLADGPTIVAVGELTLPGADTATFLHALVGVSRGEAFAVAE